MFITELLTDSINWIAENIEQKTTLMSRIKGTYIKSVILDELLFSVSPRNYEQRYIAMGKKIVAT